MTKRTAVPLEIPPIVLPEPFLLDVKNAARLLGATQFATRELIRTREIVSVAVGNRRNVSPTAIREWVKRKEDEERAELPPNHGIAP
jgi:excisionase family DNA binding protein